jgi:hypothetical protein
VESVSSDLIDLIGGIVAQEDLKIESLLKIYAVWTTFVLDE